MQSYFQADFMWNCWATIRICLGDLQPNRTTFLKLMIVDKGCLPHVFSSTFFKDAGHSQCVAKWSLGCPLPIQLSVSQGQLAKDLPKLWGPRPFKVSSLLLHQPKLCFQDNLNVILQFQPTSLSIFVFPIFCCNFSHTSNYCLLETTFCLDFWFCYSLFLDYTLVYIIWHGFIKTNSKDFRPLANICCLQ